MLPEIDRGSSYRFTYTHKHNGVATSLQGATVAFVVKEDLDDDLNDTNAIIRKSVTTHLTQTGDTLGKTVIELTPNETLTQLSDGAVIPQNTYNVAIKVKHADGFQLTEYEGKVKIDASATNVVL